MAHEARSETGAQVIYRGTYVLVPTLGVVNWLL